MKLTLNLILCYFTLFSFAQTWQSAYDSCLKYQELQQFKTALEWGDKALELYEKQVSVKDTNYSNILNTQFNNCYDLGQYKKAKLYAQKDSIWTKSINNLEKYANACNNLGLVYEKGGFYDEAELLYKTSLTIRAKVSGKQHLEYATVCSNLAGLYRIQGRYIEAELFYKEGMSITTTITSKESSNYLLSCNNIAVLYQDQGRYNEADSLLKEAKTICVKVLGKEHYNYAMICNNLASLYRVQGRYTESELLFKEAKSVYAKTLGTTHPDYAFCCNNLALLYHDQGRYTESHMLQKELSKIYTNIWGKQSPFYAQFCNNLGSLYRSQGYYSQAESLYKEAMLIRIKVFGKEHLSYAVVCNNLARLYQKQNRYTEAESLDKISMAIRIKVLGKEHPDYATSCNNLAALYQAQGRYVEAEPLYKEAKEITTKVLGKEHPDYATYCNNLAVLYQAQGKYSEAEPLYKEAISIKFKEIEQNFKNLSEAEKESYIKANIEVYFNRFQTFVQKRYIQNPAITIDAYNLTLETKGLILQSTEKIKNRILNSKDENLKNMYLEWKQTKDKYAKALNFTVTQRQQKGINLEELAQKVNELEKQLALKSEDFAHTFVPKPVTWKDIQNALKKDQAAVEMVRINAKEDKPNAKESIVYMALIIKKSSQYPEMITLSNGDSLEREYLINYKRSIRHKIDDPYSYNAFWKSIAKQLIGIKTVYFSPEGAYHQINLATLQNPETQKYVFDEIQIINVTNTKDILETHSFVSKKNYLIGNPTFNLEIDTKNNEKPEEQRSIGNVSQLEGAEKEVKEVSNFFQNATTIIGKDATEEYVKSLKNPHILHIATHGYFKKGQYQSSTQAMLNAGLLFAGVVDYDRMDIRPYDKEDGKLTAFEVMNMELDSTELVVMSACETGLGQASKEGVYGLQRAFKVAGSQCIIMSLWKVNDEATQWLMTKFYENWQKKGMAKRKAFETAQQDLRKQYKEPYYWGAFVMIE